MKELILNRVDTRLNELKIELPQAPSPLGAYVEAVRSGNLLFGVSVMLEVILEVKD
ncbi:hypothetical protein BN59_02804 [Legionella massiliensis]|uniref:Uncharacterized protein n=1 Tax=Legionella massiliensis TaxID=1034943 RepID=A0A078L314_9GAMM|nr:hypothetical protein BN59_02804 [Legionella massiliensis]CEE14232.1 hypothetical protein BN1094_02804 [Legionella massiliensis]